MSVGAFLFYAIVLHEQSCPSSCNMHSCRVFQDQRTKTQIHPCSNIASNSKVFAVKFLHYYFDICIEGPP